MASPTLARKGSSAYEKGVREGRAMSAKSRTPEPEEAEEEEGEEEEMDMASTNRKRSAKGAKNTKAPMDGGAYGKKPMDGECGCKGKKGGKCDGSCGGSMRKRGDAALTPHEYLNACDLGIQDRSRSYIRARLDAAERLDLKCGKGSISKGEKCSKGAATQAPQGVSRKTLTGKETGIFSRERIKREGYYGSQLGGDPFSRKGQAARAGAFNAAGLAVAGALLGGPKGALAGAAIGGAAGLGLGALTGQINRSSSRAANRSLQREKFEKPIASEYGKKRAAMKAGGATRQQVGEYDQKTAMRLARGYDRIQQRTKGRYGADSVYAAGFTPDTAALAI
jgi:hypothetical protein